MQALHLSGSRETGSSWFNFLSFPCQRFKHSCRYSLWVKCSPAQWSKNFKQSQMTSFQCAGKAWANYIYISPHIYKHCSAMKSLQWSICLSSGYSIFLLWLTLSTQSKENSAFAKTPGKPNTKSSLYLHFVCFFINKLWSFSSSNPFHHQIKTK